MAGTLFGQPITSWDAITIGSWRFERTRITISGPVASKIDVAPAPGTDGARETYLGYIPAKITVAVLIYSDPNDTDPDRLFRAWAGLIAQVKPKPGKTAPSPISVSHPTLRVYGLSAFLVEGTPIWRDVGPQQKEGQLALVEYFPHPKATGKQSAATLAALPSIFDGDNRSKPTDPQTDNAGP